MRPTTSLIALSVALLGPLGPSLAASSAAEEAVEERGALRLTLAEAIERGLRSRPQVEAERGAVESARAAERASIGAYYPTAQVEASALYGVADRVAGTETGVSGVSGVSGSGARGAAGVAAGWDAFTGGRRGAQLHAARAELAAARAQLTAARAAAGLEIARAFFSALRARELVRVSRARVDRATQVLEAAARRVAVGSATRSDQLRASLELNTAKQALLQQEADGHALAYGLGRLVGSDGPVEPLTTGQDVLSEAATPRGEGSSRDSGSDTKELEPWVNASPAVVAAAGALEGARATFRATGAAFYPTVRVSAGYDVVARELQPSGVRGDFSARVSLSYPLFDGFVREEASTRAQSRVAALAAELEDRRRAVRAELARVLGQVRLSRERIVLADEAVTVASEDVRVQEERYRLGVATILELVTSQASLVEAQNGAVTARFDRELALAELAALKGEVP